MAVADLLKCNLRKKPIDLIFLEDDRYENMIGSSDKIIDMMTPYIPTMDEAEPNWTRTSLIVLFGLKEAEIQKYIQRYRLKPETSTGKWYGYVKYKFKSAEISDNIYIDKKDYNKFFDSMADITISFKYRCLNGLNTRIEQYLSNSASNYDYDWQIKEPDARCPQIGLRTLDCLIYCSKHMHKYQAMRVLNLEKTATTKKINIILSFYLNAYFALQPEKMYDAGIKDRTVLYNNKVFKDYCASKREVDEWKDNIIIDKELVKAAFIGVASVCKKSHATDETNPPAAAFVSQWFSSRINTLFTQMGYRAPKKTSDLFSRDILIVAKYLDENLQVRKFVTHNIAFTVNDGMTSTSWVPFRDYVRLIMSFTGLSSMHIAYQFAKNPMTGAHSFDIVIMQTEALIAAFESHDKKSKGYGIEFLYLQEEVPSSLQLRSFPDLAFCALYKKKIDASNSSWDNYVISIKNTVVDQNELRRRTMIPLIYKSSSINLGKDTNSHLKLKG